jgi:hypothetical protein
MDAQKLLEVIGKYEGLLQALNYEPLQYPTNEFLVSDHKGVCHALWLLGEAKNLVKNGELYKALRWICFVQGVIWMTGALKVDRFREDNKGILLVP